MEMTVDIGLLAAALVAILIYLRYSKQKEEALETNLEKLKKKEEALQEELDRCKGHGQQRVPAKPTIHDLSIKISASGVFQLRNKQNELPGPLPVRPGDIILWNTGETEAAFQFPRVPFFTELRDYTVRRDRETYLELTVSTQIPPGAYVYAVYCKKGGLEGYAEGGTPPEIIVKDY